MCGSAINSGIGGQVIHTSGEIFPDGTVIELIDATVGPRKELQLVLWDGVRAQIGCRIERYGNIYVPIDLSTSVRKAIRFPDRSAPFGSIRELFEKIIRTLGAHASLHTHEQRLSAFFFDRILVPGCPFSKSLFTT